MYVESDDSATVQNVGAADVDAGDFGGNGAVDVQNENGTFGIAALGGEDESRITTDERAVNGSATDVVLVASDSGVAEDFDRATEDAEAGAKLSSLQTFGLSTERTVVLVKSGDSDSWRPVPVYSEEAPDSVDSDSTYAVQKDVGGETGVVTNLGSGYDDASTVEVKAVGSAGFSTFAVDYLTAGVSNAVPLMG